VRVDPPTAALRLKIFGEAGYSMEGKLSNGTGSIFKKGTGLTRKDASPHTRRFVGRNGPEAPVKKKEERCNSPIQWSEESRVARSRGRS